MTYYGRRTTSFENEYGILVHNELRLCVFNRVSGANKWAIRVGFFGGKHTGTNTLTRGVLYETNSSLNPTELLAYGDQETVSVASNFPSGGDDYEADWAFVHDGNTKGVQLYSGRRYAIGMHNKNANFKHSMRQASAITADNEQFYFKFNVSSVPDPVGSYSSSIEGHMNVWVVVQDNRAPRTPQTDLAPSGVVNTITPTITADFEDLDGLWGESNGGNDAGDQLKNYQIQVVRVSDNVVMWDSGILAASSAEKSANAVSKVYAGTTLVRGTDYKWRIRVSDRFDTWSSFSAYTTFLPADLGFVTVLTPTGKIEDSTPDFTATWTHQTPLSTNAARIQIQNAAGATLQTSGWITDSTAHNGTITLTWAEASAAGLVDLGWDKDLRVLIQGRDTLNVESAWSDPVTFRTNAAPGVPTNLASSLGNLVTSYPLIRWDVSDEDDTVATGLVSKLRIKDSGGTVLFTRSGTYNSGNNKWEYQITSTDFATFATYRLDAYAGDGTLWSGEVAWGSEASATKSAELQIVYGAGPAVTMDEPDDLDTITTSSLLVQWTVTGQVSYQVKVAEAGSASFLYDSGVVSNAGLREHTIPAGYIRNGNDYDIYLLVTNATPLTTTTVHMITADFTEPAAVTGFQAIPTALGNDSVPTSIVLSWEQTLEPLHTFVRQEIWRRSEGELVKLANLGSPFQTSYTDFEPVSGVDYQYEHLTVVLEGLDTLTSEAATGSASVILNGAVLVSVEAPQDHRSVLHLATARKFDRKDQTARFIPPAGIIDESSGLRLVAKPITIRASSRWFEWDITADLITWNGVTAQERYEELLELDAHGGIVSYRDDRGRLLYGTIDSLVINDVRPARYQVSITLIEETFIRELVP